MENKENKKCPSCGIELDDDCIKCPACGEELEENASAQSEFEDDVQNVTVIVDEVDGEMLESDESGEEDDDLQEEASDDKKTTVLKGICIALAAVLVIVCGFFAWNHFFGGKNNNKYTVNDIAGKYEDTISGKVYTFIKKEITADVFENSESDDMMGLADNGASSDGESKKVKKTFDGTYTYTSTEEYIKETVLNQYIMSDSELSAEYTEYVKAGVTENTDSQASSDGTASSDAAVSSDAESDKKEPERDINTFAKEKGISQEMLDEFDKKNKISESMTESGYWDFDKKNQEVTIYNLDGRKLESFYPIKDGMGFSQAFYEGKIDVKGKDKLNAVLSASDEIYGMKITMTLSMYDDGNFILKNETVIVEKVDYINQEEGEQLDAGEYEYNPKDDSISIKMNGEEVAVMQKTHRGTVMKDAIIHKMK